MFRSSAVLLLTAVLDAIVMNLGFAAAFLIKFGVAVPGENLRAFIVVSPYIALTLVVFFLLLGLYSPRFRRPFDLACNVVIGVMLTDVAAMAITFFARAFAFPRSVFAMGFVLQACLLPLWRILVQRAAAASVGTKSVVIVGGKGGASAVARKVGALIGGQYEVTEAIDLTSLAPRGATAADSASPGLAWSVRPSVDRTANATSTTTGVSSTGEASDEDGRDGSYTSRRNAVSRAHASGNVMQDVLTDAISDADMVLCVASSLPSADKEAVLSTCLEQDKEVLLIPELYDILLHKAEMSTLDDVPVLHIQPLSLTQTQKIVKRAFDLALAIPLCVLLFPAMAAAAIAILLTPPGPVLFIQPRVGERGRVFRLVKFRTMVPDSERDTGPVLASVNDPRVTRVGRFLRASRLDELPQLINVIRGDMSFVGPRPERPFFASRFQEEIPDYKHRFRVKPGITGLAQIEGKYSSEAGDKLRYDLYYIRNYSLLLDIQIILQTLRMPFAPVGSARSVRLARKKGEGAVKG